MELILFLQYMIIGIISLSGLLAGKMLVLMAPEELNPGKKNLILFLKVVFVLMLISFAFFIDVFYVQLIILFILGYFLYKIKKNHLHKNNNYYMLYTAMGFFLGFTSWEFILYPAFLCFLIGLPIAALNHNKKLNVYVKLVLVFMLFYIAAFMYKAMMI